MARPNLSQLTETVIGTAMVNVTASEQTIIPDPRFGDTVVPTGHSIQVDAVYVTNKHTINQGSVTLTLYRSGSPSGVVYLAFKKSVSLRTMFNLLNGKQLYLTEGDYMTIKDDHNSVIDASAPYVDMTDL